MILHGNWLADSYVMALWAEEPELETKPAPKKKNPRHPQSTHTLELLKRLPEELDLFEDDLLIALPTREGRPIASTTPIHASDRVQRWKLETVNSIADCICSYLLDYDSGADGYTWGASMQYWQRLARFAQELVDRGCYAPGIARLERRFYPGWQAVFTTHQETWWHQLEQLMPPICLANFAGLEDDQGRLSGKRVAMSFVDACVDHLVRQRILRTNSRRMQYRKTSAPVHRQWLALLKAGRLGSLDGTPRELQLYADDVRAWNEFMRAPCLKTPYRPVFELIAPDDEKGMWDVRYALQAAQDPSLLIRADQIWAFNDGEAPPPHVIRARELLLAGLGKAVEVFPLISESLHDTQPSGCEMDRFEAIDFMSKTAPLLRRRGFHVILPSWWEDPYDSLQLTLKITPLGGADNNHNPALGVEQMVEYNWDIALGDRKLSEDEFKELSQAKEPLVHRQGKWYRLDSQALGKSLSLIEKRPGEKTSLDKALRLGLELERTGVVPVIDFLTETDADDLINRLKPNQVFKEVPPPASFVGELRPYQIKGFSWLGFVRDLGFGACLADDMGLGKTVQMIVAMLHEREIREITKASLIICPMSVVGNWVKEIRRFAPEMTVMVHHGSERDNDEAFAQSAATHDIVITTYALAVRDQKKLHRSEWTNIILDEAQNIKNPGTKQALAIRSLKSDHRFALTGTPIENRLTELWSIMEFLNPGYLGKLSSFRSNFSVPIERDKDRSRADVLQKIIRPFVLRRLKSDSDVIRDLPEKQEMKVFCNLTTEQATLYQAIVDEMLASIDQHAGIARRGMVLSTLMKLKQVTNHPSHFLRERNPLKTERSGKLQRLEEMLDVLLQENDRALVFTQFSEFGDLLHKRLQKAFNVEVLYLHGGTPKAKREEMVNRFQSKNGPPIFLLSLKAGGVGLNLTAACHVFHFDRWWNPAVEDQATDRAFRIGQTQNVQVHKYVCIGTVEEKIDQMLDEKKRLADFIVTPGEQILTELSTDELRDIFSLTRDAVVE